MLQSFAMGGPRDGIKLTAGLKWDGRVRLPGSTDKAPKYHRGRYEWDWDYNAWIWHSEVKAGTPRLVG